MVFNGDLGGVERRELGFGCEEITNAGMKHV